MHAKAPTFGFVTIGSGSYLGSTVRDLTIANLLHRRGFKVVVYWMLECKRELVDPGITQRMLCHGTRYHFRRPSAVLDQVLGRLLFLFPPDLRLRVTQRMNNYVDRLLTNLIGALNGPHGPDPGLVRRLRRRVAKDGVSHLLMSFASLGPLARAARRDSHHPFDYLLTFQGDEQFADYAQRAGVFEDFLVNLNDAVRDARWPSLAVSRDYLARIADELHVPPACMSVLYNGVEFPKSARRPPFSTLTREFPELVEDVPIVAFVGRQEAEKGVDLLLYAAKLLERQGVRLQLAVCGATAKGESYRKMLTDLGAHLGLTIHHAGAVSMEVRDALFAHSRCAVCPSVNREAFGLVVAEAMSHGTPVVVPDYGGVTEVIRDGEHSGGLTFRTWDSGDLARQIGRLLGDEVLHRELSGQARIVAARFTAERMVDRILAHLGIEAGAPTEGVPATVELPRPPQIATIAQLAGGKT